MPEEAARVANVPTQDTQAYDLYLRALKSTPIRPTTSTR